MASPNPKNCKRQVSLLDFEDVIAHWHPFLPMRNETRPDVIREQLVSMLPWIKEKVVYNEAKISPNS